MTKIIVIKYLNHSDTIEINVFITFRNHFDCASRNDLCLQERKKGKAELKKL
jgi:hypothetical protein